jgi:hypothetical protein
MCQNVQGVLVFEANANTGKQVDSSGKGKTGKLQMMCNPSDVMAYG